MTTMNNEKVQAFLPHRFPFLLVDKVLEVKPGISITAIKNITANEPQFAGHFPLKAIMPGVLMIEALAQASGILIFETLGVPRTPEDLFFLAGVDEARFKRMVEPGDQLHMHVELIKRRLNLWKFKGTATVDGELACFAIFMNMKADGSLVQE